ncbi:hypothetical protein AAVH_21072 [Aphelenchoides avenae]|nr:hypothetical protein AAVH_21072 [Aphelenchus avenae]
MGTERANNYKTERHKQGKSLNENRHFVIYAKAMGELGTKRLEHVDACNLPRLFEWVKTTQGRLYFEFSEKVGSRGAWLIGQDAVPQLYRVLLYSALNTMGWSECRMGNLLRTEKVNALIYNGSDLARDLFELYVRLVVHFEYVCHVILMGQLKEDVSSHPGIRVVRQIDAMEHWFAKRWTTISLDAYRKRYSKVKPYVGYEPMLESFPKANVLIVPYAEMSTKENITNLQE